MENRELEHRLFIDESMILDNHKKLEDLKVNVNVNTGTFNPTSDNPASQKSIAGAMEKLDQSLQEKISTNKTDIAKNTEDIAKNTEDIAKNTEDITKNTSAISSLESRTKNLEDSKVDTYTKTETDTAIQNAINNAILTALNTAV